MKERERIVAAVGVTFNDHDGTSRAFVSAVFSRVESLLLTFSKES